MLSVAFDGNELFGHALKEAFETFINVRQSFIIMLRARARARGRGRGRVRVGVRAHPHPTLTRTLTPAQTATLTKCASRDRQSGSPAAPYISRASPLHLPDISQVRQSRPAELIARFIDSKLRTGNKVRLSRTRARALTLPLTLPLTLALALTLSLAVALTLTLSRAQARKSSRSSSTRR